MILLKKDKVKVSKRLWAFAQWGRLVRPGAKRIEAGVIGTSACSITSLLSSLDSSETEAATMLSETGGIFTSAFLNPDSSIALHIINNSTSAVCVNVQGIDTERKVVRRYLTNEDNDFSKMSFHPMAGGSCGGDIGGMVEGKSVLGLWVGSV